MKLKTLFQRGLLAFCLATPGAAALADQHRTPSAEGATIAFANLADGDVVPPGYVARFTISGMGIAPAGSPSTTQVTSASIDMARLPRWSAPAGGRTGRALEGQTEPLTTWPTANCSCCWRIRPCHTIRRC
jgi:hypothetical protein